MRLQDYSQAKKRRQALEKHVGVDLGHIGTYSIDERRASARNCENMIGAVQVPIGVAGPLKVINESASRRTKIKSYYVPLATTEGALVASVNRGCKAITKTGGALVDSTYVGATRGPVFLVKKPKQKHFIAYVKKNNHTFDQLAKTTSNHIQLLNVSIQAKDNYVYVRFSFDTQDAMGMNMVTIAAHKIVKHIEKKTSARCLSLSGNVCVDKKPSVQTATKGRGYMVRASVLLATDNIKSILKTTKHNLYNTWHAKCAVGSEVAGLIGNNAHIANIIAAMFIATGQDPGHVVEGSHGTTTMQKKKGGVLVTVFLPGLMVGTVGGGTSIETQKQALELLGVYGGNNGKNAKELSRIVGAAALAGEISLLASLSEQSLARAHKKHARGGAR